MVTIELAVAEALDAIGDDEEYASVRAELLRARRALREGTTAEAHAHLLEADRLFGEACPI
jgi:hypothetical protein